MKILTIKNILTVIATILLFIASNDPGGHHGLPYGYFTLLRFVVCAVTAYITYKVYQEKKESLWVWVFGFIAVLFNPFILVTFQRSTWSIIDLIVGIFLVASLFLVKINKKKKIGN
jgi:hypothetical protein